MDSSAWEELQPWLAQRLHLPIGSLFCVINGPTRGRTWSGAAARADLARTAQVAGVRRRFAPHQLRHAHAVEMAREGVPLVVIQRQLGHSNLGIASIYLQASTTLRSRHRAQPPPADDSRQRLATALTNAAIGSCLSR
jgi:site-specific recombinase XerD